MNIKDALAAIRDEEKPKRRERKEEDRRGQKREQGHRQGTDRNKRKDNKTPQMVKFTPLVIPVDKILAQIKDEHYLKWPRPLHLSPNVHEQEEVLPFP